MNQIETRGVDIALLAHLRDVATLVPNAHFLVTGSLAVEALTQKPRPHVDLDINVFVPSVTPAKDAYAALLTHKPTPVGPLAVYKTSPDRLEYDTSYGRRLELRFIKASHISGEGSDKTFQIFEYNRYSLVPTTMANLLDEAHGLVPFRVKSLAYALATWALRISGHARNPLRAIRDSDREVLGTLMQVEHGDAEVVRAMAAHPQAPEEGDLWEIWTGIKAIFLSAA